MAARGADRNKEGNFLIAALSITSIPVHDHVRARVRDVYINIFMRDAYPRKGASVCQSYEGCAVPSSVMKSAKPDGREAADEKKKRLDINFFSLLSFFFLFFYLPLQRF